MTESRDEESKRTEGTEPVGVESAAASDSIEDVRVRAEKSETFICAHTGHGACKAENGQRAQDGWATLRWSQSRDVRLENVGNGHGKYAFFSFLNYFLFFSAMLGRSSPTLRLRPLVLTGRMHDRVSSTSCYFRYFVHLKPLFI